MRSSRGGPLCASRLAGSDGVVVLAGWTPPRARSSRPARYATPAASAGAVLRELSGFAASRIHPGIFWAHNDSGNAPALYALRADGSDRRDASRCAASNGCATPRTSPSGPCDAGRDVELHLSRRHRRQRRPPPDVQILKVAEPARLADGVLIPADPAVPLPRAARQRRGPARRPAHGARLRDHEEPALAGRGLPRRRPRAAARAARPSACAPLRAAPPSSTPSTTGADATRAAPACCCAPTRASGSCAAPRRASLRGRARRQPVAVPDAAQPQGEAISYTGDGRGYLLGGRRRRQPDRSRAVRRRA